MSKEFLRCLLDKVEAFILCCLLRERIEFFLFKNYLRPFKGMGYDIWIIKSVITQLCISLCIS